MIGGFLAPARRVGLGFTEGLIAAWTAVARDVFDASVAWAAGRGWGSAPPTSPTGLGASAVSAGRIDLAWTAATDDIGVVGYLVYRDGTLLTSVPVGSTVWSDTGLSPATAYRYTVAALDRAGNASAQSSEAQATTMP